MKKNLKETGICLSWDGQHSAVLVLSPAGESTDVDGNSTVRYLPVEFMADEIRRYVGGYFHESRSGLSGELYVDKGRWEKFPWLDSVGTYRVDVSCTELHPAPTRGLPGVKVYVPWASHEGIDERHPAVIVAGDTVVFCRLGVLQDLLEAYRQGFPVEGEVVFDKDVVIPESLFERHVRTERVAFKFANLFGKTRYCWQDFLPMPKRFDALAELARVRDWFGIQAQDYGRVHSRRSEEVLFLDRGCLARLMGGLKKAGWRKLYESDGFAAFKNGDRTVGWADGRPLYEKRTQRALAHLPADLRGCVRRHMRLQEGELALVEFEADTPTRWDAQKRLRALKKGITFKVSSQWRNDFKVRTTTYMELYRWLETADRSEPIRVYDPAAKNIVGDCPTIGHLAGFLFSDKGPKEAADDWGMTDEDIPYLPIPVVDDYGDEWSFCGPAYWASRILRDRMANGRDDVPDDYIVRFEDSLAAGNCRPGTERFVQRHFLGQTETTYGELKRFAYDTYVRQVLAYVRGKFHRQSASGQTA